MQQVVLVIHLLLAVALVGIVLVQKSEGGGLGIGGGGGGGMSGFMTGRSQANLLTRATAILAACFFATSLGLAYLASGSTRPTSILDTPVSQQSVPSPDLAPAVGSTPESAPAPDAGTAPAGDQPAAPAAAGETAPTVPSVPLGQ